MLVYKTRCWGHVWILVLDAPMPDKSNKAKR